MREEMFLEFLVGWTDIYNYTKYQNGEAFCCTIYIKIAKKDILKIESIFYISVDFINMTTCMKV